MRRLIILIVPIVVGLIGCSNIAGPIAVRHMDRADALAPDGRPYTIAEQEARGRQRYSIPESDFRIGPSTGFDRVDPTGRGVY
jgi:hypothetical protein